MLAQFTYSFIDLLILSTHNFEPLSLTSMLSLTRSLTSMLGGHKTNEWEAGLSPKETKIKWGNHV